MKIEIEVPDDKLTKAVYAAVKELDIGKIIAKELMEEKVKTSKEGFLVDAIDIYDTRFVESLLEDFGYEVEERKDYRIRSLYENPLRVVDVVKKVGEEGRNYYLSDGGLRVLDYRFLGLGEKESTMKDSKEYKGIKEILEKGEIDVRVK
ncbi:MAG: hypothetical protein KAU95_02955 [Candidatus Aenigmarchaeota archaeon]|nr:hypothetical protein [Candidatus Aenigmarchaeota archaeon]